MRRLLAALPLAALLAACSDAGPPIAGVSSFEVTVTQVNGADPPSVSKPLPANRGDKDEAWDFTIEAHEPDGSLSTSFAGVVRLTVRPGSVLTIDGTGAKGRNIQLAGGKASGTAHVTGVYGPTRLWVEDLGYEPAKPGTASKCANGEDDDGDVLVDFPNDPGCAYADDDTEEGGTYAAGVSAPVQYLLPKISDIQGVGSTTPYPFEGMEVNSAAPEKLVVIRVSSDGFYVVDLAEQITKTNPTAKGYNGIFAFNFSTPGGMQPCDRVTYLAGTVNEFFGFTELSFPSYRVDPVFEGEKCEIPEATVLDDATIANPVIMEQLESNVVRLENVTLPAKFGPKPIVKNVARDDASSCDLNGDGQVDFTSEAESSCVDACDADPACSEWTGFSARGNYRVRTAGGAFIQINTGTATGFDPTAHKGEVVAAVTGTMRNFSGGNLNWTVETRCAEDLACATPGCGLKTPKAANEVCISTRSTSDNDQGTN